MNSQPARKLENNKPLEILMIQISAQIADMMILILVINNFLTWYKFKYGFKAFLLLKNIVIPQHIIVKGKNKNKQKTKSRKKQTKTKTKTPPPKNPTHL